MMSKTDKSKSTNQIATGKIKEAIGKATGDDQLEREGNVDQMKGHLKRAGKKASDAVRK